jgi:hypothetical protein
MDSTFIMTILFVTDSNIYFFLLVAKRISHFRMFYIQRISAEFITHKPVIYIKVSKHIFYLNNSVKMRSLLQRKRAKQTL